METLKDKEDLGWESPWEEVDLDGAKCSVMSEKYLEKISIFMEVDLI